MPKSTKARPTASSAASAAKSAQQASGDPKGQKAAPPSKQSRVIAMLQSPGATIAAMMKATGWQPHSVRGFLAGVVRKRLKLKLGSRKVDGERVYQIAGADRARSATRSSKQRAA
jgi:Protein of unknown function (DUF3489)